MFGRHVTVTSMSDRSKAVDIKLYIAADISKSIVESYIYYKDHTELSY